MSKHLALFQTQPRQPFDTVLVRDCQRMNTALEKFAELFADVDKINRESLKGLQNALRDAGRADLADKVAGWLE